MKSGMKLAISAILGALALVTVVLMLPVGAEATDRSKASARLQSADGATVGYANFTERSGKTLVTVRVTVPGRLEAALDSGIHGFHIHANNDPANGTGCIADSAQPAPTWFVSADGHWKDEGETHGFHRGDLPSLLVSGSEASLAFTVDAKVKDLTDKALVVHAGRDNFGNVPVGSAPDQYTANSDAALTKTAATGNSGDRVACGVIQKK